MYIKLVSKYGLTDIGFEYNFLSRGLPYKIKCKCNIQGKCHLYYRDGKHINTINNLETDMTGEIDIYKDLIIPKGLCVLGMMIDSTNIGDFIELIDFQVTIGGRSILEKIMYDNVEDMIVYNKEGIVNFPIKEIKIEPNEITTSFYSKLKGYNLDRCFIIGNGPSVKKIDLSKLKGELIISCNHFLEESKFVPTINCAGDVQLIFDKIYNYFEFDNDDSYSKTKNGMIYVYNVSSFLMNCFDFQTKKFKKIEDRLNIYKFKKYDKISDPEEILKRFQDIINDSQNFFLIKSLNNFNLTKNIYNLLENPDDVFRNVKYTNRYYNVIPMISMLIAEMIGVKRMYLIGCDGQNFDEHFYDKKTGVELFSDLHDSRKDLYYKQTLNGFVRRQYEYKEKKIDIINCNTESKYNFYKMFPLEKVINSFTIDEIDNYIKGVNDVSSLKIRKQINT